MSATINVNPLNVNDTFTQPIVHGFTPIMIVIVGLIGAVLALISAVYFVQAVLKANAGTEEMERLRRMIYNGARAYLLTQYKWLSLWVVCLFVLISLLLGFTSNTNRADGVYTALCFVVGSFASALAGYIGMLIATQANSRTAQACIKSISHGLEVSFASGAVMGNGVVGLGLLGLSVLYLIFTYATSNSQEAVQDYIPGATAAMYSWSTFSGVWNRLAGFGFGASTIGMFARVGGGVFTKAADVGSDLVGKVEQGIPEDDPRNPAVIADNVGDNVGDVAGMGADLFESYAGAVIATATLAPELAARFADTNLNATEQGKDFSAIMNAAVALPFWINGFGILASLFGIAVVRNTKLDDRTTLDTLLKTITNGVWLASAATLGFSALCVGIMFRTVIAWKLFGTIAIGLVAGVIIAKFTEYCTAYEFAPTRDISAAAEFGAAPVIIKGMGVGMFSVSIPTLCIAVTILACNALAGQYGVAISAVGLLSTLGITLATDAYGPVADNAGGIAEMAGLDPFVRNRTDKLDSLGNTTAATGKGLAIASATLTAVGLIAAFVEQSGLQRTTAAGAVIDTHRIVDLSDSLVLTGVLIGACLPYIFAALTMLSVDRGARSIIIEVRLQFATAPLLMQNHKTQVVDGVEYPNPTRCVQIATEAAIQEMILPGVLAVFVPVIIGFLLGPKGTCGLLGGALGGCFMLALTMATAGGAWDNAKKWCERCAEEGEPVDVVKPTAAAITPQTTQQVSFARFGIKKAGLFQEIYRTHGVESLISDPALASSHNTPEGLQRLQEFLSQRYHDRHGAAVVGDTVGDPFKDTSGPSLNILIKTMTMMALMLAPAYNKFGEYDGFGQTGGTIAAVMAVVIGTGCYFLVSYFRKLNARKDAESARLKKEADARLARGTAAGVGFQGDEEGGYALATDGVATSLLHH